jgi:DNA-binding MarR family transcriptional regulator
VDDLSVTSMRRIEAELLILLRRVRRTTADNARLVHPDLPATGYRVLMFVVDNEPTRAADVVEALDLDKGVVSRQVGHLQQLGLLSRTEDPEDRRAHQLVLSDEGRKRLGLLRDRRRDELASRLSDWSPASLAAFADQLGRYNASFETDGR